MVERRKRKSCYCDQLHTQAAELARIARTAVKMAMVSIDRTKCAAHPQFHDFALGVHSASQADWINRDLRFPVKSARFYLAIFKATFLL